jgi:hypothetical protein
MCHPPQSGQRYSRRPFSAGNKRAAARALAREGCAILPQSATAPPATQSSARNPDRETNQKPKNENISEYPEDEFLYIHLRRLPSSNRANPKSTISRTPSYTGSWVRRATLASSVGVSFFAARLGRGSLPRGIQILTGGPSRNQGSERGSPDSSSEEIRARPAPRASRSGRHR